MSLLEANAALLSALPQIPMPTLLCNADIGGALAWCEDKVIAITEVLLYDSSKQSGKTTASKWHQLDVVDDNQTLPDRQVQLSILMENLLAKDVSKATSLPKYKVANLRKNKKKLGLSRAAITNKDSKLVELRSPRAVMVPIKAVFDSEFDAKMLQTQSKQDTMADDYLTDESFNPEILKSREAQEMCLFVNNALATQDSSALLRRQNIAKVHFTSLPAKVVSQSRGWALDSLLKSKNLDGLASNISSTPLRPLQPARSHRRDASAKQEREELSLIRTSEDDILSRAELKAKMVEVVKAHAKHQHSRNATVSTMSV